MNTPDLLGKGIYTIADAARIVHTYPRNISRWSEGYSFPLKSKRIGSSLPILLTKTYKLDEKSILTFEQLMEIRLINLFRSKGVKLPVIRAAAQRASHIFGTDHPFAVKGLATDGKEIFRIDPSEIQDLNRATAAENLALGQRVIGQFLEPYLLQLEYDDFDVARFWALPHKYRIVLDPQRSFGQAIDVRSGVPARVLYSKVWAGEPIDRVAKWYGVDNQSVRDATDYGESFKPKSAQRLAA